MKNNFSQKIMSFCISACMLIMSITSISAMEIVGEDELVPIVTLPQELIDIVNGSDELIDYFGIYGGDAEINWGSSDGRTATHQYITASALMAFYNDMPNFVDFAFFNGYEWEIIMSSSDLPDVDETDGAYKAHFYDPNTQKNYLNETSPTAKTKFVYWYNRAVDNYPDNYDYAFECLGRALHYMQDACEPHHSSNSIAGLTNHSQFEAYVDENRASFGSVSSVSSNTYSTNYNYTTATLLHRAALFSNGYADEVLDTNSTAVWDDVAEDTISKAIEYCACVVYNFAKDVGINVGVSY